MGKTSCLRLHRWHYKCYLNILDQRWVILHHGPHILSDQWNQEEYKQKTFFHLSVNLLVNYLVISNDVVWMAVGGFRKDLGKYTNKLHSLTFSKLSSLHWADSGPQGFMFVTPALDPPAILKHRSEEPSAILTLLSKELIGQQAVNLYLLTSNLESCYYGDLYSGEKVSHRCSTENLDKMKSIFVIQASCITCQSLFVCVWLCVK